MERARKPDPIHNPGPKLAIDSTGYEEVFDNLVNLAKDQVRLPEQMALYILKEEVGAYIDALNAEREKEEQDG